MSWFHVILANPRHTASEATEFVPNTRAERKVVAESSPNILTMPPKATTAMGKSNSGNPTQAHKKKYIIGYRTRPSDLDLR